MYKVGMWKKLVALSMIVILGVSAVVVASLQTGHQSPVFVQNAQAQIKANSISRAIWYQANGEVPQDIEQHVADLSLIESLIEFDEYYSITESNPVWMLLNDATTNHLQELVQEWNDALAKYSQDSSNDYFTEDGYIAIATYRTEWWWYAHNNIDGVEWLISRARHHTVISALFTGFAIFSTIATIVASFKTFGAAAIGGGVLSSLLWWVAGHTWGLANSASAAAAYGAWLMERGRSYYVVRHNWWFITTGYDVWA